ncbi:MAG: type III-A CRISPR-associated RAMP protein Csm4 [Chloroflexota bacterium]
MPQLTNYHLTFPRGIHIGAGGVESVEESRESVPSDTLFAALLDTWRHLGRDVKEILPENGEPAFRVTSAFPFAGGVRFYPKPVDLRELFTDSRIKEFGAGKNIKKIRYLSEALIERARKGEFLDNELKKDSDDEWACKFSVQGGALWLTEAEIKELPESILFYTDKSNGKEQKKERPLEAVMRQTVFTSQTAPRVTVDRISSASNLFQSERVLFNAGCGLWFGVAQTSSLRLDFATLLAALGDSGLGGERTAGYGHFTFEPKGELPLNAPQSAAYLLSRWHPKADEVALLANSAYKLEAVEGWLRTPENAAAQRRKRLWLVAEGSLIAGNPQGGAADVRPEYDAKSGETIAHPIYRPGFALALDWKLKPHERG